MNEERCVRLGVPEEQWGLIVERVNGVPLREGDGIRSFQKLLCGKSRELGRSLEARDGLTSSLSAMRTRALVCDPLMKTQVLASSTSLGSLAWSARFERWFFGLLSSE